MKPEYAFILRTYLLLENELGRVQSFPELNHIVDPVYVFLASFGVSLQHDDEGIEE
jgi:hypothetical protein